LSCSFSSVFCSILALTLVGVAAEAAAEVVTLPEALKGSVSLAELAVKLEQRDAAHDADMKDLRI
jgi:hypothetical protein